MHPCSTPPSVTMARGGRGTSYVPPLPPSHMLHLVHEPLLGLPAVSPPLHRRVVLTRVVPGDARGGARGSTSYDVIPVHPRRAATAAALLRGRCVPAYARVRPVRGAHPRPGGFAQHLGPVRADEAAVRAWVVAYRGCACGARGHAAPHGLSLCGSSCWRFAELLAAEMVCGRLAGGPGPR